MPYRRFRGLFQKVKARFYSENDKNFLTLLSGGAFAQLFPLLASVILARLYTPEEFGTLAIFTAIVMTLSSIANLRYEFAIVLPTDEKDAVAIVILSIILCLFYSLLIFIIIIFFKDNILHAISGDKLGNYIYIIPLAVFLNGIYNSLSYYSLRFKKFKDISISNITRSAAKSILQIVLHFSKNFNGLILGDVSSIFIGNHRIFKNFRQFSRRTIRLVCLVDLKKNAILYKNFPLISSWGMLLNVFSLHANNFFINRLFGLNTLGFYSYSYKYLAVPLSLISTNMGQVFYQACVEENSRDGNTGTLFVSTLKKLLVICFPIFFILYFVVEDAFAIIFGNDWRIAGLYAKIMVPVFFIRTIFGPLSQICLAFQKQKINVIIQGTIFLFNIIGFVICVIWKFDVIMYFQVFTYLGCVAYLLSGVVLYLIALKRL